MLTKLSFYMFVAIISLLNVGCDRHLNSDKYKLTNENIFSSMAAIQLYKIDTGQYPDVKNWRETLIEKINHGTSPEIYMDQWRNPLQYTVEQISGECMITVFSARKDESGKIFLKYSEKCKIIR